MKPVFYSQETPTSCVAACVRMILSGFGKIYSEGDLREILGNPILGLTLTTAHKKLIESGANVELDDKLNLDDLRDYTRQDIFPIVGVERHILGYSFASHAVVVIEVSSENVLLLDPLETAAPKIFKRETFETAWKLSGKEALLLFSGFQKK
jgi:ABC-type bacteriocin/lantibiotic exporter with double-glycine peptidase domain